MTELKQVKHERKRGVLIWYYLSRFFNQCIKDNNQHLKQWDLTTAQFDVLVQIGSHQPISQKELGEKLLVTKGNITQLIKKMVDNRLVKKQKEWKTNYLSLTDAGEALYQESIIKQENFQAAQFQALSPSEQKQLLHLLKKLYKVEEQK